MSLEPDEIEQIGVVGAGYVGLVAGACFSSFGFDVGLVEVDGAKLNSLKEGKIPIYEPGLEELVEGGRAAQCLSFYGHTRELFEKKSPDVIFVAVGTPENPDGSCNLTYLERAIRDVAEHARRDVVLVLKSTVPVGTAKKMKDLLQSLKPLVRIGVVNNPEFLKEGSAVSDFLRPERVLIGGTETWALERIKALYGPLLHNGRPLFVTDHETAELSKLAANLMLASRVSLINQVSRLAASYGADIRHVESVLRSDSRIGSKYLYAGLGYGGSCFPKDVKDFIHLCKERGVDASMAQAVDAFNDTQKLYFREFIRQDFPQASQTTLTLLGVAFKPETDDIRESPALALTEALVADGYKIQAYDPKALPRYRQWLEEKGLSDRVQICSSLAESLKGTQALVLVSEWQEFQRLGLGTLPRLFKGRKIYDGKNVFHAERMKKWGFEYMGVGH